MPKQSSENIIPTETKLEYIGLNLNKIPDFLKTSKMTECNLIKEYKDSTYKVYKYLNVNDIQIFITQENVLSDIQKRCKLAKPIEEYLKDEDLKSKFIQMVQNVDLEKVNELENEQDKFGYSYPASVCFKTSLKWRIYYSKTLRKYFMIVSCNEKETEAMFFLLKKQIQSAREKVAIKIYVPIANEVLSENFLTNVQVSEIENNLWYITKKWPMTYEIVDIYGNRSMHIVGKTFVYQNLQSNYEILIKNQRDAIEKYELLKEIFLIVSNLKNEYNFNVKINEKGLFYLAIDEEEITLDNMNIFLNNQSEEKIEKIKTCVSEIDTIDVKLKEIKEEFENKADEFNTKQKQIVMFLQCKKTFLGRFKYFFKSVKKNKKINRISKIQKVDLIDVTEENNNIYEKKDYYYIEDLLAICNIFNKKMEILKSKEEELKLFEDKIQILNQKIKNADLYISEIESHKKSIFEFWKFTNKDIPNELNEAEKKIENNKQITIDGEFNYNNDIEKFEKLMDNMQIEKLSKNEMDIIFGIKDYINVLDILCKKDIEKDDEDFLVRFLEEEKEKYEKIGKSQNIIYYDAKQNINIHTKNINKNVMKDKYKIMNFSANITMEEFKANILKCKRILEKANNKIKVPYNIPAYTILENNKMHEWCIVNLNLEDEIEKEGSNTINIIRYNINEGSSALFYTNHIIYANEENNKFREVEEKNALINLSEFEISLKTKQKERISNMNNFYENVIKTIKIYEYDLKPKKTENINQNIKLNIEKNFDNNNSENVDKNDNNNKLNARLINL